MTVTRDFDRCYRDKRGEGRRVGEVICSVCVEGTEVVKGGPEGMRAGWGEGEGVKIGLKGSRCP